MEINKALEDILWKGPEYKKGLRGRRVLILGYYSSNVKEIFEDNNISNRKLEKMAVYMGEFFNIDKIELIKRIAYINLYNEKERRKEDFEELILSCDPDIVMAFGVNLRRDIFVNKNIISYDDDLYHIIIDNDQDENSNIGYIHRLAINGAKPKLLLTPYSLNSNNYKFTDNGKLSLFMNICFDNEMYKVIVNSKPKEIIRIKTAEFVNK